MNWNGRVYEGLYDQDNMDNYRIVEMWGGTSSLGVLVGTVGLFSSVVSGCFLFKC